jgi:hypothetical protein
MTNFEEYHRNWLSTHPNRTEEWLRERLKDGFDIHHMDGNHDNNDSSNLVLIESQDHMSLHGGNAIRRIGSTRKKSPYSIIREEDNKLVYSTYIELGSYSKAASSLGLTVNKVKLMVSKHQLQLLQQAVEKAVEKKTEPYRMPEYLQLKYG